MKKHLIFSLIFVALLSCTKTINFDDERLANQVVINGIITPDAAFTVYLTQSGSILMDRQTYPPLEGSMDVYEEGTIIKQFPLQLAIFTATDFPLKAGRSYRIVVTSSNRQINAETSIPYPADVMSVDTSSFKDKNGLTKTNYKINLKDTLGDDYYRIVVTNETLTQWNDAIDQKIRKYYLNKSQDLIISEDPVFKSVYNNFGDANITPGPENDYFIFPDTYFQGKEYTIEFQTTNYLMGNAKKTSYSALSNKESLIFVRQVVHVQRLSKELYIFLKYLKLYNYFQDNPFSEPISVYSNVKNGVGIFAGFNDDARFTYEYIYLPFSMDTITIEEKPSLGYE